MFVPSRLSWQPDTISVENSAVRGFNVAGNKRRSTSLDKTHLIVFVNSVCGQNTKHSGLHSTRKWLHVSAVTIHPRADTRLNYR
jgi:hypothetical protein